MQHFHPFWLRTRMLQMCQIQTPKANLNRPITDPQEQSPNNPFAQCEVNKTNKFHSFTTSIPLRNLFLLEYVIAVIARHSRSEVTDRRKLHQWQRRWSSLNEIDFTLYGLRLPKECPKEKRPKRCWPGRLANHENETRPKADPNKHSRPDNQETEWGPSK